MARLQPSQDPRTQRLVREVLEEMQWLHEHRELATFPELVGQRFTRYFSLGTRLRDEDPAQFAIDLLLTQGFKDPEAIGFMVTALQLFLGLGMVGSWTTVAEQLAAHAAALPRPRG